MGFFHPDDDLPVSRRLVGAPKTDATIPGDFVDTVVPDSWRKHDAQAAYDPDAMPAQYVPNPCEGADDKRPADPVEWAARLIFAGAVLLGVAWWQGWLT